MVQRAAAAAEVDLSSGAVECFFTAQLSMSFDINSPELHVTNRTLVERSIAGVKMRVRCSNWTRRSLVSDAHNVVGGHLIELRNGCAHIFELRRISSWYVEVGSLC